ncbi:MAG TPA: hypothetical protein VL381_07440 [Rhodocyclaceae bacterium]|nr:hypothetical protein [Rhodocyclaceae bacterium]
MQCPYCISEINDAALACPHCAHDIYLYKPLLEKIAGLEAQLEAHPDVVPLRERVAELEAQLLAIPPERRQDNRSKLGLVLRLWLPPLLLLLLAHVMMTIVYDVNTLYLRIASILIPLPFGFALMRGGAAHFGRWFAAAFGLAVIAVLGMSGIISIVDHTPILPHGMQEWREFIEYAGSIGFSFATGMLLGETIYNRTHGGGLAMRIAKAATQGKDSAEKVQAIAKKLNDIGGTLTAVATTAISIYTGLKGFFGN